MPEPNAVVARLRHRVTLQTPVTTPDGAGGASVVWSDVASLWAEVRPLSARQRIAAMQTEAVVTHRVTVRARSDITVAPAMRLLFPASPGPGETQRVLAIRGIIDPGERRRVLELLCEERGSG